MVDIWHTDETPGYDKGKQDTTFTKWRLLAVERAQQLIPEGHGDAVELLHERGLHQVGLDFESGMTAEQMAQRLISYL